MHYILRNREPLDFLLIQQTKLKIIKNYQKVKIFQLLILEKLVIILFLKKNIYRKNNIQKVLMPLMAKYTKILMRLSVISDSIYLLNLVLIS